MNLLGFVISLLSLVCVIVGGLWTVYSKIAQKIDTIDDKNQKKIDDVAAAASLRADKLAEESDERTARIYGRMDENKKQYYENFVLKELHNETIKHQNELIDQKFVSMLRIFETNMNAVTKEIQSLREYMIERFNTKSGNGM